MTKSSQISVAEQVHDSDSGNYFLVKPKWNATVDLNGNGHEHFGRTVEISELRWSKHDKI